MFLIEGLGKYTFECGMIYFNSLLRSSILFAAETMYNVKEKEFREIERVEEDLLRKYFNTFKGCPIYMLYLESGVIPARFAIKRMKLVFFRYILTQKEASLLYQFLLAQKNDPKQGDWYSEIKRILNKFELDLSDEAIMMTKETIFKNLVKKKALSAGLKYLTEKQKKGEKGRDILYESFQLQDYLCP